MTLPQMIWGKPHVEVEFIIANSGDPRDTGTYLECKLTNPPIENRLLRMLGVYRRTADEVTAQFHIENAKTHKRIATNVRAEIGALGSVKLMPSVALPASKASALFRIVKVMANGVATVTDRYDGQNFSLPVGEYYVDARIFVSEKELDCRRKFIVGTKPQDLHLDQYGVDACQDISIGR